MFYRRQSRRVAVLASTLTVALGLMVVGAVRPAAQAAGAEVKSFHV